MTTPEAKVKAKLKKCLDALAPHVWYYMPVSTGYGKHGVPDFLICVMGDWVAIETKANGGKPTPLQIMQLNKLIEAGAECLVVDEHNVEDTCVWLQSLVPTP